MRDTLPDTGRNRPVDRLATTADRHLGDTRRANS